MDNHEYETVDLETIQHKKRHELRIPEKTLLTVFEAAALTGIGTKKLAKMASESGCDFVIYVGSRRMFKRKKLEEYLESHYSV